MKQAMKRIRNVLSVVAILMIASRACSASSVEGTTSVRLVLPAQAGPVVENTGKVFTRQVLLTPQAKKAWRWRQLYLRALLDAELKTNGGKPNERCNEAFAELIKIDHAENANPAVRPPLPKDYEGKR